MPNTVEYEWTLETLEGEDIVDSSFSDTPFASAGTDQRLGLVRNEGNEVEGLVLRLWAYVVDGRLPEYFEDATGEPTGYRVPKRFAGLKL